jgi:hypothetical protein
MIKAAQKEVSDYLVSRIGNPTGYRGMHLVQHQRLPIEKFETILLAIFNVAGNDMFIEPSGDDPDPRRTHQLNDARRAPSGMSLKDCKTYWDILDEIARINVPGVGASFNSLKKNTFPNLEAMGIMHRFPPDAPGGVKTAKLSKYAIEFLTGSNRQKMAIYSNAMQTILAPLLEVLDRALERFDSVNVYEMMLFLTDDTKSIEERVNLLGRYKLLKRLQTIKLHTDIQELMNKKMGSHVPKKEKLDWHNWWNESKQMLSMLSTVVGYSVLNDDIVMRAGDAKQEQFNRTRSQLVKTQSLEWHGLEVKNGWELHHIIPVEYAASSSDLRKIDDKRNMLYIPRAVHRLIPNNSNLMVQLDINKTHVVLRNPLSSSGLPKMEIQWPNEAGVISGNFEEMIKYNKSLLGLIIA